MTTRRLNRDGLPPKDVARANYELLITQLIRTRWELRNASKRPLVRSKLAGHAPNRRTKERLA